MMGSTVLYPCRATFSEGTGDVQRQRPQPDHLLEPQLRLQISANQSLIEFYGKIKPQLKHKGTSMKSDNG